VLAAGIFKMKSAPHEKESWETQFNYFTSMGILYKLANNAILNAVEARDCKLSVKNLNVV
jgi:hypothetical protein